ncbi:hypothetical protein HJG60_008364 [Phyllostomus discolor]|uniref:Uncharacterized protein n=1 Tax=Phyllostomus discolor TaxID=89673 RepID=A0A833Z431_9CHIR|nr:hypothetical protein HJG60_008364 [Phyllostomus discolor]
MVDTEHPHSASHSLNCSFSETETSELPFSPGIPKEVTASLRYSWGPKPEHAHWPQRTGSDPQGLSLFQLWTGPAGSDSWGIKVSRPSQAQSSAGSAPPPFSLYCSQLLGVKAATKALNETCVGLLSRKPPGDPIAPQTSICRRRKRKGRRQRAERSVWPARAAAGTAGRGQATSPFSAPHRLARGGSRHHTLRPGCARCSNNEPLWPPAPSAEEQCPLSPPPPPISARPGHAAKQPAPPPVNFKQEKQLCQ